MEEIMKYVKPELLMVAVVLYFIGIGLKQSQAVRDKYIPLILGGIGIVLCAVWGFASCPTSTGTGGYGGRRLFLYQSGIRAFSKNGGRYADYCSNLSDFV